MPNETLAGSLVGIVEGSSPQVAALAPPALPAHIDPGPTVIARAGTAAIFAWEEFFQGEIANPHTRKNYDHAVRRFLGWSEAQGLDLLDITPGSVGRYFQGLPHAVPTKKLHLAAVRKFFDRLVNRHLVGINPAATVRAECYSTVEGKTPEIHRKQAEALPKSIETTYEAKSQIRPDPVGLRDRAILAVLIFTASRVGAVAKLTYKSLRHDGSDYALRFSEKGGKSREIPVRSDLQKILRAYIQHAGISGGPLFRTGLGKTKTLTNHPMSAIDICRMMKRRLKAAGLPTDFLPHSFRVTTITDLLEHNTALDDGQPRCLLWQFCPGFLPAVSPTTCRSVCHSSRNPICVNAIDTSATIIRNVASVIARGCTPHVGVSDEWYVVFRK